MVYVCMNEVGYETHLAQSDDLLKWDPLGKVLSFRSEGWDASTVSEQQLSGTLDPQLGRICAAEERILVTYDRG